MKNFINDLIEILKEKYNNSFSEDIESNDIKEFSRGLNFAYFDILNIIETQLKVFGYNIDDLGVITPKLGRRIDF